MNGLADDALTSGIVARKRWDAHFAVYPMSLSEPDPIVAVNLGSGPALLGHPLKLRERGGESPVDFTLRLLGEMVSEANRLAGSSLDICARPHREEVDDVGSRTFPLPTESSVS